MSVALAGSPVAVPSSSRSSTTVGMPSGLSADTEVRVFVGVGISGTVAPTITPPATATLITSIAYGSVPQNFVVRISEYRYLVVGSGDPASFVFTHPTGYSEGSAVAFTGVSSTTPDDVASTTNSGEGTTATFSGVTTATPGAMIVGIRGSWDGNAITPGPGWTEDVDQPVSWTGHRLVPTAGVTGDLTISAGNSSSQPWGTIMSVLRDASATVATGSITSAVVSGMGVTVDGTTSGAASLRWGDGSTFTTSDVDSATTTGQQPDGWTGADLTLVMSEEFGGSGVTVTDSTLGRVRFRTGGPEWASWYAGGDLGGHTNNLGVEQEYYETSGIGQTGGNLVLTATLDHVHDADNLPWTSGMITSNPFFNITSGYFEARMKSDGRSGGWPAWWMIPASYTWPPEIDIMDAPSGADSPYITIGNFGPGATVYGQQVTVDQTAWHTWGLLYDGPTGVLKWYLDGSLIATEGTGSSVPNEPMYLVCNLAVRSGAITTSLTEQIDYIRAWQTTGGTVWEPVTLPATHTYGADGTYTIDLASDGAQVDTTDVTIGTPVTPVTYVGAGTFTSGTGALSVPLPTGATTDDVLVLAVESANQTIVTPSDWTSLEQVGTGTGGAVGAVRVGLFWRWYAAGNVSVADSVNHTTARVVAFRGCDTTTPISAHASRLDTSGTTVFTGPTATIPTNGMALHAVALDLDASSTNTELNALTGCTLIGSNTVTSGFGGGLGLAYSTTASQVTQTGGFDTSTTHAYASVSFNPVAASGTVSTFSVSALSTSASLSASGVVNRSSTATLPVTSTLTASGSRGLFVGASYTSTSTTTSVGIVGKIIGASRSISAALTSTGFTGLTQSAFALAASVAVAVVGTIGTSGGASLPATAAITASGTVRASSASAIPASATITSSGSVGLVSGVLIPITFSTSGGGTTAAAGVSTGSSATFVGSIPTTGQVGAATGSSISTTGTISASGVVNRSSTATLPVTSTLTASGSRRILVGTTSSLWVSLSTAGFVGELAGATQSDTVAVTSSGSVGAGTTANLPESSTITASGTLGRFAGATSSETATLSASGAVSNFSAASLSTSASLSASGAVGRYSTTNIPSTVTISGAGSMSATGSSTIGGSVSVTASGSVVSAGTANSTLQTTATLTASGVVSRASRATALSTLAIIPVGSVGKFTGASAPALSTISTAGSVGESTNASLSSTSTLSSSGNIATTSSSVVGVTSTITASGGVTVTGSATATLPATTTLTASGTVGRNTAASLSGMATLVSSATTGKISNSTLLSTSTLSTTGTVSRAIGSLIGTTGYVAATGSVGVFKGSTSNSTSTVTASGSVGAKSATSDSSISLTGTLVASGIISRVSGAALTSTVLVVAAGSVSTTSGSTIPISGSILAAGNVDSTTGADTVGTVEISASGTTTTGIWIRDPHRTIVIPAESRTMHIRAERRTLVIPFESRTVNIRLTHIIIHTPEAL